MEGGYHAGDRELNYSDDKVVFVKLKIKKILQEFDILGKHCLYFCKKMKICNASKF